MKSDDRQKSYYNRKSVEDSARIAGWCAIGLVVFVVLLSLWPN